MQQHLLLLSTLTVLVGASSRWQATSRSSSSHTVQWRIDLNNSDSNIDATLNAQIESELGNNDGDFMRRFSQSSRQGKERRLTHDLGFDDTRARRGSKKSSSSDNVFDHGKGTYSDGVYYYGKSSSSSSKGTKKSGKSWGKGGSHGHHDGGQGGNGGGGGVTSPPTTQPTMKAPTPSPTEPPPTTITPTTPKLETPSPTKEPQREIPTLPPFSRPTPTPRPVTPPPSATEPPVRNCVVDENGLFGAQIGVAEVIPFAYELDVFGNPTTQQLINMVSTMEEGISNFVIQELFATCATSAASLSQQKEVPPPTEKTEKVREHHHVSSGLFPATPTTTFQSEEDRHQSHPGGGGSFAAAASVEWDEGERRHNHNRNGQRSLQQTSRLTGLSSRPKDVVVNVPCSGPGLGFRCFPVNAQLTVYSQEKLDSFTIEVIKASIDRALDNGDLDKLDNRVYRINSRDLDRDPFPDEEETPSPTPFPTFRPFNPNPNNTPEESKLPLPLWAIISIGAAVVLLIFVLFLIWCLRRRKNMQYTNSLDNTDVNSKRPGRPGDSYKPPPSNLNSNTFGRQQGRPPPGGANRPQGSPDRNSFGKPNPHPSTEFGPPNPHPSPFKPPNRLGATQLNARQNRPGSTRPAASSLTTPNSIVAPPPPKSTSFVAPPPPKPTSFVAPPPPKPTSFVAPPPPKTATGQKPTSRNSFGDNSKGPDAKDSRNAAYGLGPIKSPAGNKNAIQEAPIPSGGSLFSGADSASGEMLKSVTSGSQSFGELSGKNSAGNQMPGLQSFGELSGSNSMGNQMPAISSASNSAKSSPSKGSQSSSASGSGDESASGDGSGSGSDSDSEESEENISLTSSEKLRRSMKFGDPDNAFGDPNNAFGIGISRSSIANAYNSSSSSYEEEVEEEYEIEYVSDEEEVDPATFQNSSGDEDFWDDEVVEEVVDDPDQPILGGFGPSS